MAVDTHVTAWALNFRNRPLKRPDYSDPSQGQRLQCHLFETDAASNARQKLLSLSDSLLPASLGVKNEVQGQKIWFVVP
jgi:hypothetical protein